MATADPYSVDHTGNPYLDALLWGSRWDQTSGPITYDLWQTGDSLPWKTAEKIAVREALASWSAVANLDFRERDAIATDMNVLLMDLGPTTYGQASGPNGDQFDGLVAFDPGTFQDWPGQLRPGGFGFSVILHEIGHAIGLAHPHDLGGLSGLFPGVSNNVPEDTGTYRLNTGLYSVMSYNDVGEWWAPATELAYGFALGPMAFDIAVVQHIYGANMSTAAGNDVYGLPGRDAIGTGYRCIWDAGGSDRIIYTGAADCTIDLRAAPLTGAHAGGFLSRVDGVLGGFTIANGALIEAAVAGSGDDLLIGNGAANLLAGGLGRDTMIGTAGNDLYYVDDAGDVVVENAPGGTADVVRASISYTLPSHVERLVLDSAASGTGNGEANLLIGSAGSDRLYGLAGNDSLDGGAGADWLDGGVGFDLVSYATAASAVVARLLGASGGAAAGDRYGSIEQLLGSAFNDYLQGSTAANSLLGRDGNDRLYGEDGNDRIYGEAGADLGFGDAGLDRAYGGDGADFLDGGIGIDLLFGGNENDRLAGGEDADRLFGDLGDDRLYGGSGDDILYGGDGEDIAWFVSDRADYAVTRSGSGLVTVTELAPIAGTGDGVDRLVGVEWLRFADIALRTDDDTIG